MNGYKCFYRGKTCEVHADTSYQAQQQAAQIFRELLSIEVLERTR
jgi:hypothetical protein